jgi:hypothetical protein
VPLSAFASTRWITGAMQTVRYNGYPAMRISGSAAPGYSTGAAMAEMERWPPAAAGFGFEWTGQSREEKLAGSQALVLYGFAILAVFLCLAALYESWSIPLAVILVVPLGVLGVLLATLLRGYANDVYFQVGLITIIGLSAKNAILIIEFAKDLQAQGKSAIEAALAAAHLRFRPIVMTSMAFILGVLPLAWPRAPGSASQRAIGTGVIGGMLTAPRWRCSSCRSSSWWCAACSRAASASSARSSTPSTPHHRRVGRRLRRRRRARHERGRCARRCTKAPSPRSTRIRHGSHARHRPLRTPAALAAACWPLAGWRAARWCRPTSARPRRSARDWPVATDSAASDAPAAADLPWQQFVRDDSAAHPDRAGAGRTTATCAWRC